MAKSYRLLFCALTGAAAFTLSACGGSPEAESTAMVAEDTPMAEDTLQPMEEPVEIAEVLREADILRPDLYNQTDMGLWDGRPSIGGAWIAHPLAGQAERVRITNLSNGFSAVGALFERDPTIPGPPFLISAEAATLLGAQPGVPTQFNVIALRREIVGEDNIPIAERTEPASSPVVTTLPVVEAEPAPATEPQTSQVAATQPRPAVTAQPIASAPLRPAAQSLAGTDAEPTLRPYIQVGVFAVAANAQKLATELETAGYTVDLASLEGRTRILTRVLVGPIATVGERNAIERRLTEDGYSDLMITTR